MLKQTAHTDRQPEFKAEKSSEDSKYKEIYLSSISNFYVKNVNIQIVQELFNNKNMYKREMPLMYLFGLENPRGGISQVRLNFKNQGRKLIKEKKMGVCVRLKKNALKKIAWL